MFTLAVGLVMSLLVTTVTGNIFLVSGGASVTAARSQRLRCVRSNTHTERLLTAFTLLRTIATTVVGSSLASRMRRILLIGLLQSRS